MKVQWEPYSFSSSFSVSNGVRQGSVLSPVLFGIYLDGLLEDLSASGVGCYWQWLFVGAFVMWMILFYMRPVHLLFVQCCQFVLLMPTLTLCCLMSLNLS